MFNTGYQPFPFIPMQQNPMQGPTSGVVYVPIQTGNNGKMPKPRSLAKQYKEYLEVQGLINPKKEEKKDDKGAEMKMSPITFLMWIWALSIPVAAVELALLMAVGKYIKASFG